MIEPSSTADSAPTPISVVCGMHRSGTSLFARFLDRSGIAMGERLHVDLRTNPYGHFEDEEFLELQRVELARAFDGEDYLVARPFTPSDGFRRAAVDLLRAKRARASGPWGWKDPRTTLFLDLWKELAPDVHAVAMVREPRAVLDSLCRRLRAYWSPRRKAHLLATYTHYNRALLDFARRRPESVTVVPLEALIAAPEPHLERVSRALGVSLDAALFRDSFDPRSMSRSRRASVFLHRTALAEAEAVRAALLSFA